MGMIELAAELSDEEVNNDLTKSEMSQDQLFCACCDISSKSACPVEKIKKRNGIGHGTSTWIICGKTSTRSVWKKGKKRCRYKEKTLKNLCGGFAKKFLKKPRYK